MSPLRIGSLCSGYRGLDMAIEEVFGATTAWVSDVDEGANKILAHRWPATPNLGDLTTARWEDVEPVDIVCGGYPCQPFSTAGLRKGTSDERHIWPYIEHALGVLRPRIAVFENVAGHLRLGFDTVLAGLARLGFDVQWCCVRASEVGAPHQRNRLFIVATAADTADLGHERSRAARAGGAGPSDRRLAVADATSLGRGEGRAEPAGQQGRPGPAGGSGAAAAGTDRGGLARHAERDLRSVEPAQQAPSGDDARRPDVQRGAPDWGKFAPAVARWEAATGHRAPRATDDRNRLSPAFVEWMMGLPAGHVTAVPGLTRAQQLKALGNGVVPQQAAAALRLLAARAIKDDTAVAA